MPDHVHMLLEIPPEISVPGSMGIPEGGGLAAHARRARRHRSGRAGREGARESFREGPEEEGLTPVWPASHGPIRNAA